MNNFLKVLQIIQMIPTVVGAIQAVSGSQSGKQKSFQVAEAVTSSLQVSGLVPQDPKRFAKARQKMIDATIEMAKACGAWDEK